MTPHKSGPCLLLAPHSSQSAVPLSAVTGTQSMMDVRFTSLGPAKPTALLTLRQFLVSLQR